MAAAADVRQLVLTHIPAWDSVEAILDEARPHFSGSLQVAHDGLTVEIQ
jgi:ribonuclease BN (tRNA processing enzyme)